MANHVLIVDDEQNLLDTYRQYLDPPKLVSPALDRLRALRAGGGSADSDPVRVRRASVLPEGWVLTQADSGERALEIVRELKAAGDEVCVGIFDVKMAPGIDGIETMARTLEIFPRMRCAIVSAYNDRTVDEINTVFGPIHRDQWDFMNKPFSDQEIRQKMRTMAAAWLSKQAELMATSELESLNANLQNLVSERTRDLAEAKDRLLVSETRMRMELEAAARVQVLLHLQEWPVGSPIDSTARVESSVETGGDVCGVLRPSPDEYVFYMCDVLGHGAGAALGTVLVHATLRSAERHAAAALEEGRAVIDQETGLSLSPGRLLRELNVALRDATKGSLYATCLIMSLNLKTSVCKYASAGHEGPLKHREGVTSIVPLLRANPLGSSDDSVYQDTRDSLFPGDTVLLFTDGLIEATPPEGVRPFHRGALFKLFHAIPKETAAEVSGAIFTGFRKVIPAELPMEDDVTFLVVRRPKDG